MRQPAEPKYASYIEAIMNCTNQNSYIASVAEVKAYWKYADSNGINTVYNRTCRNSFWTSNKPLNGTHLISGNATIEQIEFNEFVLRDTLIEMKRTPVASFETLKLEASATDYNLCICVLYEVRKVQNLLKIKPKEVFRRQRRYRNFLKRAVRSNAGFSINSFSRRYYCYIHEYAIERLPQ